MSSLADLLTRLEFRQAVLLWPVATLLHVLEEWPGFPAWARRFASPRYSDREYVRVHVLAVALAAGAALLASTVPRPWVLFLLVALVLGPSVFWNAWFHTAASLRWRAWCPGAGTSLLLYLPLSLLLGARLLAEGLLSPAALGAALVVALVFHVLEVGHNVFKRW
jgi:hypothetical protein